MRTRTTSALFVALLAIEVTPALAQSSPLVERVRMTSTVLNEAREYDVYVPPGYGDSSRRFPVLYVLDALLMLVFQDWLGAGFHAFVLWGLWRGLAASRQLRRIEEATAHLVGAPISPR